MSISEGMAAPTAKHYFEALLVALMMVMGVLIPEKRGPEGHGASPFDSLNLSLKFKFDLTTS